MLLCANLPSESRRAGSILTPHGALNTDKPPPSEVPPLPPSPKPGPGFLHSQKYTKDFLLISENILGLTAAKQFIFLVNAKMLSAACKPCGINQL